jgi:hypothetical protein
LEKAPWNRYGDAQHSRGVATVLIKRVIEESILRGYGGYVTAIPKSTGGRAILERNAFIPVFTPQTQYGEVSWHVYGIAGPLVIDFLRQQQKFTETADDIVNAVIFQDNRVMNAALNLAAGHKIVLNSTEKLSQISTVPLNDLYSLVDSSA